MEPSQRQRHSVLLSRVLNCVRTESHHLFPLFSSMTSFPPFLLDLFPLFSSIAPAKGLPPIMLSWHSHPQWRTKMPQLFYSPDRLGLNSRTIEPSRSFASYMHALEGSQLTTVEAITLTSLAWVLEPQRLAHLPECAGRPWHEIKESLKSKYLFSCIFRLSCHLTCNLLPFYEI